MQGRIPWNKGKRTLLCIRCNINPPRIGNSICNRCWYIDRKIRYEKGEPLILHGEYSPLNFPRGQAIELQGNQCKLCGYADHPEILVLHHIDKNHENNDPCNWQIVCPNCHYWIHYQDKSGMFSRLKKSSK